MASHVSVLRKKRRGNRRLGAAPRAHHTGRATVAHPRLMVALEFHAHEPSEGAQGKPEGRTREPDAGK